jgi:hypothetical protein
MVWRQCLDTTALPPCAVAQRAGRRRGGADVTARRHVADLITYNLVGNVRVVDLGDSNEFIANISQSTAKTNTSDVIKQVRVTRDDDDYRNGKVQAVIQTLSFQQTQDQIALLGSKFTRNRSKRAGDWMTVSSLNWKR